MTNYERLRTKVFALDIVSSPLNAALHRNKNQEPGR